ncbi:MAG TPA: hypothetical protein VLA49_13930 [Anaerolineales bacterium]|nr:hypothetical protein [Anaerolineales bacterium]
MAGSKDINTSVNPNRVQKYNETSLHAAIKNWYAQPGDIIESQVGGYRVDIVRNSLLIEIQTKNFSRLKEKLNFLLDKHRVHLVYPIPILKWIKRIDQNTRRLSPKKGKIDHIFQELIYITQLLNNPNLSLEVLFIHEEEIRQNDGRGSWRRKGISIVDRKLLAVIDNVTLDFPASFMRLLQGFDRHEFTSKDVAVHRNISENLARKMIYCLLKTDLIRTIGRRGRHNLYALEPRRMNGN